MVTTGCLALLAGGLICFSGPPDKPAIYCSDQSIGLPSCPQFNAKLQAQMDDAVRRGCLSADHSTATTCPYQP